MNNNTRGLDLPEWIVSKKHRPPEYRMLFEYVKQQEGLTNSEKVSQLLLLSGLRREFLSFIWSASNKQIPGILTEQEFYIVLAFVALAQRGSPLYEPNLLKRCTAPPIPNFGQIMQMKPDGIYQVGGTLPNSDTQLVNPPPIIPSFAQKSATAMLDLEEDEFCEFQSASSFNNSQSNPSVPSTTPNTINLASNPIQQPPQLAHQLQPPPQIHHNARNGSFSLFESPVHETPSVSSTSFPSIPKIQNLPKPPKSILNPLPPPPIVSHNSANIMHHQSSTNSSIINSAHPQTQKRESAVGSRLANYDLGVPSRNDVFLGDEDKYSALRVLTTANGDIKGESESVEHQIYYVSDDVLQIVKTEKSSDSDLGDFGDFVSCTPVKNPQTQPVFYTPTNHQLPTQTQSQINLSNRSGALNLNKFRNETGNGIKTEEPWAQATRNGPGLNPRGFSNEENEYGDFVGFSGNNGGASVEATSPKITVKNLGKKPPNLGGSGGNNKGKSKPGSLAFKINTRGFVKASNFLIDSPTTPEKTLEKTIDVSQSQNNASEPQKVSNLDLLSLADFGGPLPSNITSIPVFPLKTTLIGRDFDDVPPISDPVSIPLPKESAPDEFEGANLEKPKFLTPDTQSLSSLDLGNYNYNSNGVETSSLNLEGVSPQAMTPEFTPKAMHHRGEVNAISSPSSNKEDGIISSPAFEAINTSPNPIEDKYQCFKEEIQNEREKHCSEWSRCLRTCLQLISYAVDLFNSASSSGIVREVVSSPKGIEYIQNLIDVYHVGARIYRSWLKTGGNPTVRQLFQEISASWDNLAPFLLGTPLMGQITSVDDWSEGEYTNFSKVCGLCLIIGDKEDHETLIEYKGTNYHPTCINLWINCIDSSLPSLSYIAS